MKVFLTWSGEKSKRVAEILREWLPDVIQALEPRISSEDIEKGSQWNADITGSLKESKAGIICVTETNKGAAWLNFEAGAISNKIGPTLVCTFLVGLKPSDLTGPLTLFQATLPTHSDVRRLLGTLNRALGEDALDEKKLDSAFARWWPELEKGLKSIDSEGQPAKQTRSDREILEETLNIVRDWQKQATVSLSPPPPISADASPGYIQIDQVGFRDWVKSQAVKSSPSPTLLNFLRDLEKSQDPSGETSKSKKSVKPKT